MPHLVWYNAWRRFGDEGDRPRRTWIDFEDKNFAIPDRELDVHQPDNVKRAGECDGLLFDLGYRFRPEAVRRKGAGTVA